MRQGRVALAFAALLPIAAACASFGASGGDTPASAADAAARDGSTTEDAPADASNACIVADEFERGGTDIVEPPWSGKTVSDGASITIVDEIPDASTNHIIQMNTPTSSSDGAKNAFISAPLATIPTHLTCSFRFRPDTDFTTDGSGIDIFQIVVNHDDGTSVHARFSFKNNAIELRDDGVRTDGTCSPCAKNDTVTPSSLVLGQWTTMTIDTDFTTVNAFDDLGEMVSNGWIDLGTASSVEVLLGLVNFGKPQQLGSYDQFHCDLHC